MPCLTMGLYFEKCYQLILSLHKYHSIYLHKHGEYTYSNLDGRAYYIPRLYGIYGTYYKYPWPVVDQKVPM